MVQGQSPKQILIYLQVLIFSNRFIKGHSLLIGIIGTAFFLTLFMTCYLRFENSRRDKIERQTGSEYSDEQKREQMEFADNAPWFRYTV